MSLKRPSARITVDGRTLSAAEAALVALEVDLGLGRHDGADFVLWPDSKFKAAKPGAQIAVALGDKGDEEDVLAGEISGVRVGPERVLVEAVGATVALSRERRSEVFLGQTVAGIVRELAGSLAVDQVEADLKLDAYAVDNRRTVFAHVLDLARLVDADVGASASGGLRFVPAAGGGAPTLPPRLRFGAELLDWSLGPAAAPPPPPAVVAHGAGSEAGAGRWHWLLRDPVGAGGAASLVAGALHSRDGAETVSRALAARAGRKAGQGHVRVVGRADLRPGDRLTLADLPGKDPGPLRALEVRHRLDGSGFTTLIVVEGAEGGGLLEGLPL